jgi:hypothetical protein
MHLNAILFLSFFIIGPGSLSLFFLSFSLAARPRLAFPPPPTRPSWLGSLPLSPYAAQPAAFLSFPLFLPLRVAQQLSPAHLSPHGLLLPLLSLSLSDERVLPVGAFSHPALNSDSSPSPAGVRCRSASRGASSPHALAPGRPT